MVAGGHQRGVYNVPQALCSLQEPGGDVKPGRYASSNAHVGHRDGCVVSGDHAGMAREGGLIAWTCAK